jgi:hypothetical protein
MFSRKKKDLQQLNLRAPNPPGYQRLHPLSKDPMCRTLSVSVAAARRWRTKGKDLPTEARFSRAAQQRGRNQAGEKPSPLSPTMLDLGLIELLFRRTTRPSFDGSP